MSVVILLVVFFVLFSIPLLSFLTGYVYEAEDAVSDARSDLYSSFEGILDKNDFSKADLADIKLRAADFYSYTGSKCKVKIEGYGEVDSSRTAVMAYTYWTDKNDIDSMRTQVLMLADSKYLEYFNTPEVLKYRIPRTGDIEYFDSDMEIEFVCTEFYGDLENGLFIPVEIEICEHSHQTNFYPTGYSFRIEPENIEGFTHYKSVNYHIDIEENTVNSVNYGFVVGNEGTVTDEECEEIHGEYETEAGNRFLYMITPVNYIPFSTAYKNQLLTAVGIIIWSAFAFAFIPATISYNVKKRRFEIFEYRRKMVDAMAHDLKTPMAAISAYSENLSNNIATDKKEYYASKIQEKVAQMNKMVNDILAFSKSENQSAVVTKTDVDISSVIAKVISDNEHVITERSLKVNFDNKNVVVKTDEKLFEQAVSNLVNNAVLYSKEGTEIDVACDAGTLTITNISEEKLEDIKSLKQAFAKGSLARGSKGTGLGLAIADNNLAMLGYKLDIRSDGDKFIATVKM